MEEFGSPAHTYSPAYTEDDFPTILACSSHITFNSLSQYHRFMPMVEAYNREHPEKRVSCGLRVNPEYSEIETELYNPCAPGSRFGVLASNLEEAFNSSLFTFHPSSIEGFHCHNHCESSAEALQESLKHLEAKFGQWFPKLKWLNLGGGHLMTRKGYNVELLISLIQDLCRRYPNLRIILEPGSAFAWQTGPLVSSVVDIVENHGIRTAILDVSFTCHMPDCLEMPYHPEVRTSLNPSKGGKGSVAIFCEETGTNHNHPSFGGEGGGLYRLGGNSCLSGDFMGLWQFDHELQIGEQIVFEDMIHYTTVKTTMFNGIHHPSIVLRHMDGTDEVLRRYVYEDYRDRMC